jgi:hypothetical protein
MRIAYVGGFGVSWHTEVHVADALEALGQTVDRIDHSTTSWSDLVRRAEQRDYDLLLLSARPVRTVGGRNAADALDKIRASYVPIVSYHLDIYTGLGRVLDVGLDPWWKADFVFTADGGTDSRFWERKGIRHHWLCGAIPDDEVYRADRDPRFECRVAFVGGARSYLREWQYRADVLGFLKLRYGDDFRIFPEDGKRIHGDDLNRLYATADVVVGDSFCPDFIHGYYWSDRIYQTLGRGGILVHPEIVGLSDQYDPGLDFETYRFGDYIELGQKIDSLLDDPDRREGMRRRAILQTSERHTYSHRMQSLLDVVERDYFR